MIGSKAGLTPSFATFTGRVSMSVLHVLLIDRELGCLLCRTSSTSTEAPPRKGDLQW